MISPDFFGAVRELMEECYNCPVMVVQGAAGNIAPKYFNSKETPIDASGEQYIRSETALEDIAKVVLEAASPIIENIIVKEVDSINMYSRNTVLYAEVPTYEVAQSIAKESKENCGIDGTDWLKEIRKLNDSGIKMQEEKVEIQYFKIGDWCLCGVPYELMVEFALQTQEKLEDEYFYLNGYTNGCSSYFSTEKEFDSGGYEVYWSLLLYYSYFNRVFPLKRESAKILIDLIINKQYSDRVLALCDKMLNAIVDANLRKKYLWLKSHVKESIHHMAQIEELYRKEAEAKFELECNEYNARFSIYKENENM